MRSRHSPPESLLFAEFCKKFPVLRRMSRGDRFVSDCAHHHPALANRAFLPRREIGGPGVLALTHFGGDIWGPVSAANIQSEADKEALFRHFQAWIVGIVLMVGPYTLNH